ncbi:hypothetical protein ACO2Q0_02240 [Phenylobacterium sp. VNQ135]|uniref:hypothetical protein n=1 Tax=Phenylobacterium sp. VNQ135 TaxID=3400922 RepID=UPI003C05FC15
MLVYGDRRREVAPREAIASGDFFRIAEVAQGLVDAEFNARGEDDLTPLHAAAIADLRAICGGRRPGALAEHALPSGLIVKEPEGYAFYAVHPEAYAAAARQVAWPSPPLVIGLRSIGLGLAAAVAEAAGAQAMVSLRPVGAPFRREIRVSDALRRLLTTHEGPFAVVDEGPGLSGSSIGAVLAALEDLGAAPERIVVFPSHDGEPGSEASSGIRRRWRAVRKAAPTAASITGLFDDLTGAPDGIEDLSAGAWREGARLPAFPQQERLKFRLTTPSGVYLAKFAGLGEPGEAKLALARRLRRDTGMTAGPIALRRGFLLSRWIEGAAARPTRSELTSYLRVRAQQPALPGAGPEELAEMVRVNAAELGLKLDVAPPRLAGRPVAVDGRLHAWEWLRDGAGRLFKTDAVDHHRAHDLIGGQDIAWDVAGAAVEFELSETDLAALARAVDADEDLVRLHRMAYPAFQAGLWTFAGDVAQVARYRGALATGARLAGCLRERSPPCPSSLT